MKERGIKMPHNFSKSTLFRTVLSNSRQYTMLANNRSQDELYWHEINLGDKKIFIPNCINTEAVILEKVKCTSNEDSQLFYCFCSRHSNITIKLHALKKLEGLETRANWTIPFLMSGLKDRNRTVQLKCKKLLSTYDAREIERISYLNKQFILDITSKVVHLA